MILHRQEMTPNVAPRRNKVDRRQRRNKYLDGALMKFPVSLRYKAGTGAVSGQNLAERQT